MLWRVVVLQIEEAFNVLLGRIYRGEFGTPEQERLCTCVWVYPLVTLACCSLYSLLHCATRLLCCSMQRGHQVDTCATTELYLHVQVGAVVHLGM